MNQIRPLRERIYGPFYRTDRHDKWHFSKQCPDYPKTVTPEIRIASYEPAKEELCPQCMKLSK